VRLYARRLIDEGLLTQEAFDLEYAEIRRRMDEAQTRTREKPVATSVRAFRSAWEGLTERYSDDPVATGVPAETLLSVGRALGRLPDGFDAHKKIRRLLEGRRDAVESDEPLDWAMGELLAYGALLLEGHAVRLTGQDVERGTFSHRHAVVFDQQTGAGYDSLNHIAPGQAKFCVHNSPLTESACLGFEYGYSLGDPNMLVIWEAQFGDFANGAQVIFDQFIASAETKWHRYSGLTVYLPHGYEGQGPEHSSARLERFLVLCAKDDMQVVCPTTPAQMFHVLRRQMKRSFRKPLIIMTPKSLLRLPAAVSRLASTAASTTCSTTRRSTTRRACAGCCSAPGRCTTISSRTARRSAAATSPSCGSSSSSRSASPAWSRRSSGTPAPSRSSGSRRSRRTWARTATSRRACASSATSTSRTSAARPTPPPPWRR